MSQWPAGRGEATDLTVIDVDSIHRDLEETRARLAEAEWALARLASSAGPIESRLQDRIVAARDEAAPESKMRIVRRTDREGAGAAADRARDQVEDVT